MKLTLLLILSSCLIFQINANCKRLDCLHTVLIEVFTDTGLRASISHAVGIQSFKFFYKINEPFIRYTKVKGGTVYKPSNGRWIFGDEQVRVNLDDIIYYQIFIKINGTMRDLPKNLHIVTTKATRKATRKATSNITAENAAKIRIQDFDNKFDENYETSSSISKIKRKQAKKSTPPPHNRPSNQPDLEKSNNMTSDEVGISKDETTTEFIPPPITTPYVEKTTPTPAPKTYFCLCPEIIYKFPYSDFEYVTYEYKVLNLEDTAKFVLRNKTGSTLLYVDGIFTLYDTGIVNWIAYMLNLYDLARKTSILELQTTTCGSLIKLDSIVTKRRLELRVRRDIRYKPRQFQIIEPGTRNCTPY